MGTIISALVSLAIATALAIPWANALDKQANDPEWQEHKNEPEYWDWP